MKIGYTEDQFTWERRKKIFLFVWKQTNIDIGCFFFHKQTNIDCITIDSIESSLLLLSGEWSDVFFSLFCFVLGVEILQFFSLDQSINQSIDDNQIVLTIFEDKFSIINNIIASSTRKCLLLLPFVKAVSENFNKHHFLFWLFWFDWQPNEFVSFHHHHHLLSSCFIFVDV